MPCDRKGGPFHEPGPSRSVSRALSDVARPVTGPLPGPKRPVTGALAALGRPVTRPLAEAGRPRIRVRFDLDKSGSYALNMPAQEKAIAWLVEQIKADAALADLVVLAATEMSTAVESTAYVEVRRFEPPCLPAGGGSPHGAMLLSALEADIEAGRAGPAVTVHVVMCDGQSSDDVGPAVAAYRKAQEADPDFHVFPVELGPPEWINKPFIRDISVGHESLSCPDVDAGFGETFGAILALLAAAARGDARQVIGRTRSLRRCDLPAPPPASPAP